MEIYIKMYIIIDNEVKLAFYNEGTYNFVKDNILFLFLFDLLKKIFF